jgi:hypothetical protein
MRRWAKIAAGLIVTGIVATSLVACVSVADADRASQNLSTAAEQFEVNRRITFLNGITDKVLLEVEGRCSVETTESKLAGALEVTCKVGPDEYKKNFLYLSDNVTATVEQLEPIDVSVYHYRFLIKPETVIPDLDVQVGKQ